MHASCPKTALTTMCSCRPHLNFISGENGSGKSATLQCLQVCLGVDARKTGRSTTARGLINDDGNHAVAQVTIWNTVSPMQGPLDACQTGSSTCAIKIQHCFELSAAQSNFVTGLPLTSVLETGCTS